MNIIRNPKISVLMCIFNEEKYLQDSIDSVLNQQYNSFELIIVNDASMDNSLKIISSYNDKRIKLINNSKNIGLTKSLNIGLDECTGEYIARLDGNDLMTNNRLNKQLEFLENNQRIAVVGSYFKCIDETGEEVDNLNWPSGIDINIYRALYGENPVGHPGVLMKKDAIINVGKYRNKFYY